MAGAGVRLRTRARVWAVAMALVAAPPAAAAQDRSPGPAGEAWDADRAVVEMERLQTEIRILGGLAGAQAALEAWNRERAESGAGAEVLAAHLCAEPALEPWCRALPATFGADAAGTAAGGRAEDGEP